jgi:hypothetical protein
MSLFLIPVTNAAMNTQAQFSSFVFIDGVSLCCQATPELLDKKSSTPSPLKELGLQACITALVRTRFCADIWFNLVGVYLGVELLDHTVTLQLISRGTARLFPKWVSHFKSPPAMCECSIISVASPTHATIFLFLSHHRASEVVFLRVWILFFCSTGDWLQGCAHARQALHHWAMSSALMAGLNLHAPAGQC